MKMAQKNKGYALALFSIASEANLADKIFEELKEITDALSKNPEYVEFLHSPAISKETKLNSLNQIIPSYFTSELKSFLAVMCKKGDLREIFTCFDEFSEIYKEASKISVANITSAIELTEKELEGLKKSLENKTGKKLTLNIRVDKTILGGIIAEVDGKVYDGSLKRQLDEIKKVIE